jgi:N-acetylneuraminic acid mutarotase
MWVNGPNLAGQTGSYGTLGVAASSNVPGARDAAVGWIDKSDNLWLFGGGFLNGPSYVDRFNDLWEYQGWGPAGPPSIHTPPPPPAPTTYTIGGTVSGLTGTGLVLADNGGDSLPVSADGAFTFATLIDRGFPYAVTVLVQPSNPAQTCAVTANGSGVASANVTNVRVACITFPITPGFNLWTWVSGSDTGNQEGSYGTLGTPALSNAPWSRSGGLSWKDSSGNFWLFGGFVIDPQEDVGEDINDLWKFSGTEWTWMSGSNLPGQNGVYGTQGIASPANLPGARDSGATWTDASGNLWLFGGISSLEYLINPLSKAPVLFNDLWKYSAGQWIWKGGSDLGNQTGVYGTLGTASPDNLPGARFGSVSWADSSGNFWLFGGQGYDATGAQGVLNDLWKYSAGEWTWMGGSNVADQPGVYGSQGAASPSNFPGARQYASSSTDNSGNLWLFGGVGPDSTGAIGQLNDLWEYGGGQWTWVSGSNTINQPGIYGTMGAAAPNNVPGARANAVSWTDAEGNFWLYGGVGYDSTGTWGYLNDLWKYSAGQWTWVNGWNLANQPGVYGTEGTAAPGNMPGARTGAVGWAGSSGTLWLFGGSGFDSTGNGGNLNDLWEYQP